VKTGRGIGGRELIYPVADVSDEAICLRPDHPCDAQPEKRWLPAQHFHICLPDRKKVGVICAPGTMGKPPLAERSDTASGKRTAGIIQKQSNCKGHNFVTVP